MPNRLPSAAYGRKMSQDKIPLSFVCVSRNDDHGGNSLERLVYSCKNFIKQAEKFKYPCEYVVVEWNPPKDRAFLGEALKSRIRSSSWAKVRVITVPTEIHQKFDFSEKLPLFQMIGKNVGIRRAKGEFILSSNIDILLGDRLFVEIMPNKLKKGVIYRSHRLDLSTTVTQEEFNEVHALRHATRLNVMPNTIQLGSGASILANYTGGLSAKAQERKIFRHKMFLWLQKKIRKQSKDRFPLHTNACGDFHLLDRKSWARLGGYSEMNLYSFHLDSLFMYQALSLGIYSIVFPPPLFHYHIDHSHGWIPEQPGVLFNRLRQAKIGFLDQEIAIFEELHRRREIEASEFPENWGMPNQVFEEVTL
jgi:hypothetical protein